MKPLCNFKWLCSVLAISGLAMVLQTPAKVVAEDAAAIEARMSAAAKLISADEMEGRGVGTKGLDAAADYIAAQFRQIGLKTALYDGAPFQKFKMPTGSKLGTTNQLTLVAGNERIELKVDQQFNPLAIGGSGKLDLPLVFVGYGITAPAEHYDDYAGIDVKGKAVLVLRHEPQQANPHSVFDGTEVSQHAPYKRKLSNAYEHGAAAVIFCTDDFEIQKNVAAARIRWQRAVEALGELQAKVKDMARPTAEEWNKHTAEVDKANAEIKRLADRVEAAMDPLVAFEGAGPDAEGRSFPVLFVRRAPLEQVVKAATGKTLAELETAIDKGPTPQSCALGDWRAVGDVTVIRTEAEVKNIVGVLEGAGPHANETIVIGAHYDHLGLGGEGSLAPGAREIHNGADDNGSGTVVLIEVARELAGLGKKLPRRVVFIAFTGEERGLIGSARYVKEPLFPLDSTVAMLNLDMVGRLDADKLIIHGTGTAQEFDALADRYGKSFKFHVTKDPTGFGPSDHASFYGAKVPVLFFFTGNHKDYHRPSDDFDRLNIQGMRRIGEMVKEIAIELASAEGRPKYLEVAAKSMGGGGDRPYFGSVPDFAFDQPGVLVGSVTKDAPAERGGMKPGDIIIQLAESRIGNLEDFDSALRKHKGGEKVKVVVKREGKEVTLEVTLDDPK